MESNNYKYIKLDFKRGFCILNFNRPDKKNALSSEMRSEITHALNALKVDKKVRAVIFYGGKDFFSAGFDRDEVQKVVQGEGDYEEFVESNHLFHKTLFNFPKLLIAAINGFALAGAFDLAVICHLRVASKGTLFGHPEIRFGACPLFFPYMGLVGRGKALELTLNTGSKENFLSAEEAYRLNIINKLVEPDETLEEAIKLAKKINKTPEFAVSQLLEVNRFNFDRVQAFDSEIEIILKSMKTLLGK
ncbi:MAG: enoyl-CoA hydratase/isomerase family protein [Candidatus Lokiarchaeota archaeon]|nr:enoyl-CoA hydratase/isomerase family protein [Candidatus Lokiarchaeota archaeon]